MDDLELDISQLEATLINCRRAFQRIFEHVGRNELPQEIFLYGKQTSDEILQVLEGEALKLARTV